MTRAVNREYRGGRNLEQLAREISSDPDQMRIARERDWDVNCAFVLHCRVSVFKKIVGDLTLNPDVRVLYSKFSPNRPLWVTDSERPPFEHWEKKKDE
jgi:hypothetical protein